MSMAKVRTPRGAWVDAALQALAAGGPDAVRVEALAASLGVSKGGFYWHFADRRALLDAMLGTWMEGRIAAIRQQAADRSEPAAALRQLADLYTRHANVRGLAIELEIRAFARIDAGAAAAVRGVDQARLQQVTGLFIGLGWARPDAQARAVLFYSYLFGQSLLDAEVVTQAARERAITALLAASP